MALFCALGVYGHGALHAARGEGRTDPRLIAARTPDQGHIDRREGARRRRRTPPDPSDCCAIRPFVPDMQAVMSLDRRNFLQLAAALNAAALLPSGALAAGESAHRRCPSGPRALQLRAAEDARQGAGAEALCRAAAAEPRHRAADRLRRPRQAAVQAGVRAVGARAAAPSPSASSMSGMYFPKTVRMHVVEKGVAREILYNPETCSWAGRTTWPASCRPSLPPSPASGCTRPARRRRWKKAEPWATFLGASYFRAIGELGQVGLSARGIAHRRPATANPEEFPDFTEFWFETAREPRPSR